MAWQRSSGSALSTHRAPDWQPCRRMRWRDGRSARHALAVAAVATASGCTTVRGRYALDHFSINIRCFCLVQALSAWSRWPAIRGWPASRGTTHAEVALRRAGRRQYNRFVRIGPVFARDVFCVILCSQCNTSTSNRSKASPKAPASKRTSSSAASSRPS